VQKVEDGTELYVLLDHLFGQVEDLTDFFPFLICSHRPQTLEFSVVERQTSGNRLGEHVKRGSGTVVIVDVVQIDVETLNGLRDTLIPSGIVDGTVHVVHARGVWLGLALLAENGGIEKDIGDVAKLVVLDLDIVAVVENGYDHRLARCINRVVDTADAGNNPDKVCFC